MPSPLPAAASDRQRRDNDTNRAIETETQIEMEAISRWHGGQSEELNGDLPEELKTQADLQGHFNYLHSSASDRHLELAGHQLSKQATPVLDHTNTDISLDDSILQPIGPAIGKVSEGPPASSLGPSQKSQKRRAAKRAVALAAAGAKNMTIKRPVPLKGDKDARIEREGRSMLILLTREMADGGQRGLPQISTRNQTEEDRDVLGTTLFEMTLGEGFQPGVARESRKVSDWTAMKTVDQSVAPKVVVEHSASRNLDARLNSLTAQSLVKGRAKLQRNTVANKMLKSEKNPKTRITSTFLAKHASSVMSSTF